MVTGSGAGGSGRAGPFGQASARVLTARVTALVTALLLSGCGGSSGPQAGPAGGSSGQDGSGSSRPPVGAPGSALRALDLLAVKGRAARTGYSREQFGPAWADVDHNGCDTRNDVLARDLTGERFRAGTRQCVVLSGTLHDPYTDRTVVFAKSRASAVQIDHVVSLSNAWQTGAQQLTADRRAALANDPLNLLAVDGPTNQAKSDADAATWLPPYRGGWCPMVARQVAVKRTYGLWVTAAERDAMRRVLGGCPEQALPTGR